jgi:ribosomal protein S18 acetylase RimI-like enzyme
VVPADHTRALIQDGAREVALNVAQDNPAAIAVYRRGFAVPTLHWEDHATLL